MNFPRGKLEEILLRHGYAVFPYQSNEELLEYIKLKIEEGHISEKYLADLCQKS